MINRALSLLPNNSGFICMLLVKEMREKKKINIALRSGSYIEPTLGALTNDVILGSLLLEWGLYQGYGHHLCGIIGEIVAKLPHTQIILFIF